MAGDWIKVRSNLATSPKVVRIMSALKADKFRTIGGLVSAWCLFDSHSEDGKLPNYTFEILDTMVGFEGLARAMASVEWLIETSEGLEIPRFDVHNGQSAKRRAMDQERKRNVRKMSASEADKIRTREEKNREDINTPLYSPKGDGYQDASALLAHRRKSDPIPYANIVESYHEICCVAPFNRPTVAKLTDKRKKAIAKIWNIGTATKTLNWWQDYFQRCTASKNWMYGTTFSNGNQWAGANFDFLLREDNVLKVVEGAV